MKNTRKGNEEEKKQIKLYYQIHESRHQFI